MVKSNSGTIKELERVIARLKQEKHRSYLRTLDERNKRILELRGLGWTLEKIGYEYGITRERVRQVIEQHENKGTE